MHILEQTNSINDNVLFEMMVKKRKVYGSGDEKLFYAVPDENN